MIKGLHHNAYRCRDSEQTRNFYEGFLGLPLSGSLEIRETKTGRTTAVLHTFYGLDDGSFLAFFEAPDMPFEWKAQHDFDLHIALEVEPAVLTEMLAKGKARGLETRGISEHGFVRSIYFRDPNGYVIELTAKTPDHARLMDPATNDGSALRRAPSDAVPRSWIVSEPPICLKERCVCQITLPSLSALPLSSGASTPSSRRWTSAA
jgi:catechol 2,3-dioxygenase-like lactoylglutathione lyase family enzyme